MDGTRCQKGCEFKALKKRKRVYPGLYVAGKIQ